MKRLFFLLPALLGAFSRAQAASTPVTLDSDTLEIHDNGARSVFAGNVVLKQDNNTIYADRMVRTGKDGPVVATGRVRGISMGDKGEKLEIVGTKARYEPTVKQVTVWGSPRVKVHVEDAQGVADFEADEAQGFLENKEARLVNRVRGRITPTRPKAKV